MKVILLTTDTTHHRYFAWKLSKHVSLSRIFLETSNISPPFDTFHPYEKTRDEYELSILESMKVPELEELSLTRKYSSINQSECVADLHRTPSDVIVVFGTGRLKRPIIDSAKTACLNLHGGHPEEYRGLDTHLWAIYHRDFNNLVTTLHHVEPSLDTGAIVGQSSIEITRETQFHALRLMNTEICVDLTESAVSTLEKSGKLMGRRQLRLGRYYSHMPAVLKEDCKNKFNDYVSRT